MLVGALLFLANVGSSSFAIVNAKVWSDGHLQHADTLVISKGRIDFIGARSSAPMRGATIIDARGRLVIPGLIDSHTHMVEGGVSLLELQLRGARDKADFIRLVGAESKRLGPDLWLRGGGWSAESWPSKEQPRKEWIDGVTGNRPAILERMDGHSVLVNSAALKIAGIDRSGPPNPPGGTIDRNPDGEPTGILRETAVGLIRLPPYSAAQLQEGLRRAIILANSFGVTASSDICSVGQFEFAKQSILRNPSFRFSLYARTNGNWTPTIKAVKSFEGADGWVESRGVKAYMDGSLGSRTAYMHDPFTKLLPGQKDVRGLPMPGFTSGQYGIGIPEAAQNRFQVIVHAIGDQANHEILNLFEKVPNTQTHRFRVEHAQHLLPNDIKRFGKLGVIPSMQPFHKADDGRYCEEVIGKERSKSSYAFRSLLASGAKLAFGSDWPVVTINPWEGIATAVTGRILTGKLWMAQENISLDDALTCYTVNGAFAMGRENDLGRLKPGYRADIVILNNNPFNKGVDLQKVRPDQVYVEGRRVK